ncbi:MAG: EAL domain-containing protein [gamma proteobacterium symbiont of Taylorina sp.]|nr:EAL domain-containing protein [gamma proteobacterium symbiont of Taylorina sp.]
MLKTNHIIDTILFASRDIIVISDAEQQILQVNTAFENYFSNPPDDSLRMMLADLLVNDSDNEKNFQNTLASYQDWEGEVMVKNNENKISKMFACCRWTDDEVSGEKSCITIFWKQQYDVQQYDKLTALPNYFLFLDRIEQALIAAPRTNKSVALLMIGLDHFARINDGLGHDIGDKVLIAIAGRLSDAIRRSDTVARFEGDKFGLVMQITTVEDSVLVAEKILKVLNNAFIIDDQSISITASIGISISPDDTLDRDELVKNTESAMRHLKKLGGNHYQFFSREMNQKAKTRIDMENKLRHALKNKEFVVYYQPKVNLENNAVVGAEALVRWLDPEKGLIPPGDFIPVAEEAGLIGDIGEFVLLTACQENSLWYKNGLNPARISVNVTASQFSDKNLVKKVQSALTQTQLPPHLLELEITESSLIGDMEKVIEKLQIFRDMGIHISIDDFGTGYSSLSYLSRFPITTLKIDRAFINGMETDAKTAEITSAIIGLSRGLSLEVVAEGAESIEHVNLLRKQGCDLVQGFFFSRPVPANEFEVILGQGYLYDS